MAHETPVSLAFAIPNHPWVDSTDGAAVRIAMTVAVPGARIPGTLAVVTSETSDGGEIPRVEYAERTGVILSDLRVGADVASARALRANERLAATGFLLGDRGFIRTQEEAKELIARNAQVADILFELRHGKDLTEHSRGLLVLDPTELSESQLRETYPEVYQQLLTSVYPRRQQNRDPRLRREWWKFRRSNEKLREAIRQLDLFVVTSETAKHRVFFPMHARVRPEHKLVVVALDDPFFLGVLSSRLHVCWALEAGGNLGVGDDPVYVKTKCFDAFPFPRADDATKARIRDLAERLDAHRKRQLAAHPKLTITAMYNVLEKLRSGEPLSEKDRAIHDQGLVSLLKQIHDELDAAVLDAYGWPATLTDEEILERLVALNAERAAEEERGLVRWLRPEYQAPKATKPTQVSVPGTEPVAKPTPAAAKAPAWPKHFSERVVLVRDAVLTASSEASFSAAEVAARFKRAKPADVEQILEGFVALGHLVAFTDPSGTRRWARPARAA